MRNVISGGIGVLLGGAILLFALLGGRSESGGAYGAGQMAGTIFGVLLFGVGLYYLIDGIRNMNDQDEERPRRKKKRKRRVREEDEDDE
jgi:hypothetical protein